jgi:fatty-acyl-CoA synthase
MTEPAPETPAKAPSVPPKGGVVPCSRRVMNLAHLLTQNARRFPDQPGLIWGERSWSWRQIDAAVSALAAALRQRGIGKGDRILVHAKNSDGMLFSMFAAFRLGAVWVPTNFRLMPDEVLYLATSSGARAFLCQADFPDHAALIAAQAPAVEFIWRIGGNPAFATASDSGSKTGSNTGSKTGSTPDHAFGAASLSDVIVANDGVTTANAAVDHDDPAWFFFTSGTTGRSKAAVLTHGQMGFVVTNHLADLLPGATAADASLVVAPLSHGAGVHQLNIIARGAPTILLPTDRFDITEAYRLIERHRVTNMFTVPTILKLLVEHEAASRFDHSSLRHVIYAGAPMYRADQQRAITTLGKVIVQYFGLGEVTGNITVLPAALHTADDGPAARVGTCGYERTGMHVSIQDDTGCELGPNLTGEICVVGPAVFAGYYDNPEANAKAFRNGWFRTGDLGHLDDQGFLYITGRSSDMYISGGSNIYPREIEEKILAHADVTEVAVVGVPDPLWGEVGIAVCVLCAGSSLTESELASYLATRINRSKLPKRFVFWEALPKSGYGKVPKRLIRQELEARGVITPAGS